MSKTQSLEKSIMALAKKASAGMTNLLSSQLSKPIDSSGIISHTDISVSSNGNVITIESHLPEYAYWVEHGRKPGKMPPEAPIKDWIRKHNIDKRALFPIRRKIGKEGTKPKPFTEPLRRMIEMIRQVCLSYNVEYVNENIGEDLSTIKNIEVKL